MTYTLSPALRLVLSQLESAATARAEAYNEIRRVELHNLESGGGASVVLNPSQARRSASSRLRR